MLNFVKKIFSTERNDHQMSHLLYITANPKPENQSFSLSVGKAFLNAYRQENPNHQVTELDLYKMNIPYIDTDVFNGWGKLQQGVKFEELKQDEKDKVNEINKLTDQFLACDSYVFVTPLWNLSIPPKMKAYIDTICIADKTFKYTEQGPVGLLKDKKALHIQSRGGVYSEGPARDFEFGDRYIKALLTFLGVTNIESVIVEGMAQMPEQADNIKAKAIEEAKEIARRWAKEPATV